MKPDRSKSRLLILLSLLLAALSPVSSATTLLKMSLAKLSQTAKQIARVRCISTATVWDSGEIWTLTNFQVRQTWHGSLPAVVTVRLLGGTIAGLTSSVSGVPRFQPGDQAVLFLEPTRRGDFSIVSWQQGTFRIRRNVRSDEETVTQGTAMFPTFNPSTRRFEPGGVVDLPLESFRSQIEAALAANIAVKQ